MDLAKSVPQPRPPTTPQSWGDPVAQLDEQGNYGRSGIFDTAIQRPTTPQSWGGPVAQQEVDPSNYGDTSGSDFQTEPQLAAVPTRAPQSPTVPATGSNPVRIPAPTAPTMTPHPVDNVPPRIAGNDPTAPPVRPVAPAPAVASAPPGHVVGDIGQTPPGMELVGMRSGKALYAPVESVYGAGTGNAPIAQVRRDYQNRMNAPAPERVRRPILSNHQEKVLAQRRRIQQDKDQFMQAGDDHSRMMAMKAQELANQPTMAELESEYGKGNVPADLAWGVSPQQNSPEQWASR